MVEFRENRYMKGVSPSEINKMLTRSVRDQKEQLTKVIGAIQSMTDQGEGGIACTILYTYVAHEMNQIKQDIDI